MALMVGGSVMRDASGDVNDLWNIFNNSYTALSSSNTTNETTESSIIVNSNQIVWSIYSTKFNCTGNCQYGSHNSFQVFFFKLCKNKKHKYLNFILKYKFYVIS